MAVAANNFISQWSGYVNANYFPSLAKSVPSQAKPEDTLEKKLTGLMYGSWKKVDESDKEKLKSVGVPLEYIESLATDEKGDKKFGAYDIYRYHQMGLTVEEVENFKDTEKPNGLFLYTSKDPNQTFASKESIDFIKQFFKDYDMKVRIVHDEDEVYSTIGSTPNVELLYLGDHGYENGVEVGNCPPFLKPEIAEKYELTKTDAEFKAYLEKLAKNAVILIDACETAKGGKGADNFANQVIKWADGRIVYAAKKSYGWDMPIQRIYPLNIMLRSRDKDVTYTNYVEPKLPKSMRSSIFRQ